MTRVVSSWSMGLVCMCTTNCYLLIYCNPFVMPWSEAHLCIPWLTYRMSKIDGAKESCGCSLLMSLFGMYHCFLQLFTVSRARKASSTVDPHIPLPCVVGKSFAIRGNSMSHLLHKKHYRDKHTVVQIPLPQRWQDLSSRGIPQSLTDVMKLATALSYCTTYR